MLVKALNLRWIERGRERILLENYRSDLEGVVVHIPVLLRDGSTHGFVTDGGTIPRPAWSITGHPFGPYFFAYLNHDYRWSFTDQFPGMTFDDTNDLLYSDLRAYGASAILAATVIKAVKIGGRGIWQRGRKNLGNLDWHYAPFSAIGAPHRLPRNMLPRVIAKAGAPDLRAAAE